MIESVTGTHSDWVVGIARVVLGIIFFAHGAQKMLGWYGGPGLASTMRTFSEHLHLPSTPAYLVIAGELFSGIGLIVGAIQQNCRHIHRADHGRRNCHCSPPVRPVFELVRQPGRTRD